MNEMMDSSLLTMLGKELERANEKLKIAVDALKRIKEPTAWGTLYQEQEIATEALAEITSLEQKD